MERLIPLSAPEPTVRGSGGLRLTVYGALVLMLAAGAWLRFNPEIAAIVPALQAPAAFSAVPGADPQMKGLVELALLPVAGTAAAIQTMNLPASEAADLTSAVQRGRLRLARMALVDASMAAPGAAPGHDVQVSAAGYTTLVRLTHAPTVVTFPVGPVSTVSFRTPDAGVVEIGALGLAGPLLLPPLQAGQQIDAGVVAQ